MEIELTDSQKEFIGREIAAGRFQSPAEVLGSALLNLEQQLGRMRADVAEGIRDLDEDRWVTPEQSRAHVMDALHGVAK